MQAKFKYFYLDFGHSRKFFHAQTCLILNLLKIRVSFSYNNIIINNIEIKFAYRMAYFIGKAKNESFFIA